MKLVADLDEDGLLLCKAYLSIELDDDVVFLEALSLHVLHLCMSSGFAALVMRVLVKLNIPSLDVPLLFADLPHYMRSTARVHSDQTPTGEVWLLIRVVLALVNVIISILGLTRFADSVNLAAHQIDVELAYYVHFVDLVLNCLTAS